MEQVLNFQSEIHFHHRWVGSFGKQSFSTIFERYELQNLSHLKSGRIEPIRFSVVICPFQEQQYALLFGRRSWLSLATHCDGGVDIVIHAEVFKLGYERIIKPTLAVQKEIRKIYWSSQHVTRNGFFNISFCNSIHKSGRFKCRKS